MSWQFEEFMIFVAKEKNAFPWPDNILKFTSDVFDHSYQMANISMIYVFFSKKFKIYDLEWY